MQHRHILGHLAFKGGRLIKWKGIVASIAPCAFAIFSISVGGAQAEPLPDYEKHTTVNQGHGLSQFSNDTHYNSITVTTTGLQADGVRTANWGPKITTNSLDVHVSGSGADGVNISRDGQSSILTVNGKTDVVSENGMGIRSATTGHASGANQIFLNGSSSIKTSGYGSFDRGYAVYAGVDLNCRVGLSFGDCKSNDAAQIYLLGDESDLHEITTAGRNAHAVFAQGRGYIEARNIDVKTSGDGAHGLNAVRRVYRVAGGGTQDFAAEIKLTGNVNVEVTGEGSNAIIADGYSADNALDSLNKSTRIYSDPTLDKAGKYRIRGNIVATKSGEVHLVMGDQSRFEGAANAVSNGKVDLELMGSSSLWLMTNDSTVTSLKMIDSTLRWANSSDARSLTVIGDLSSKNATYDLSQGVVGDKFVIGGNYIAENGQDLFLVDSYLTGDDALSKTDMIEIAGDAGHGIAMVWVNNTNDVSADGRETLKLVEIGGDSKTKFLLQRRVVSGVYEYLLNKHADGDWYLESMLRDGNTGGAGPVALIRPEVGAYGANALAAMNMFDHGWRDRNGAVRGLDTGRSTWLRLSGEHGSMTNENGQIGIDYDRATIHLGVDVGRWSFSGSDEFVFGLMGGYGRQTSDAVSNLTGYKAKGKLSGHGLGLYGSWVQNAVSQQGWYVDGWLMKGRYNAEVESNGLQTQKYDIDTTSVSLETGYAFDVWQSDQSRFWLEPQGQLIWSDVSADTFTDESNTRISLDGNGLTSRLGIRATLSGAPEGPNAGRIGFAQLDWLHALDRPDLKMDAMKASYGGEDALRIGVGYEQKWSDQARAHMRIDYTSGSGGDDSVRAAIGLNIRF